MTWSQSVRSCERLRASASDPSQRTSFFVGVVAGQPSRARPLRRWPGLLLCLLLAFPPAPAGAADEEASAELPAVEARPRSGEGGEIEEIRIVYPPPAALTTSVPSAVFDSGRARNASEALLEIPGLDGVKRGAIGVEPVVRGLGWERVPVQVQGMPVLGAGPGRMDTPAALLSPAMIQQVTVVKGIPSVTLGPGGTGGRVMLDTDYERPAGSGTEIEGGVRGTYQSVSNAWQGTGFARGGSEDLDVRAGIDGSTGDDYESGGGVRVPNDSNTVAGAFNIGYRPLPGHRIHAGYIDSSYWDTDFPSSPLDADEGGVRMVDGGYRFDREEGVFTGFDLRGGYAASRHQMSNRQRPNWLAMQMLVEGESDSAYAAIDTGWQPASPLELHVGLDFEHQLRDAVRQRRMQMMTSWIRTADRVWPDIVQWGLGAFAEGELELGHEVELRLGARYDRVDSDARAVDELGFQRMGVMPTPSIRQTFVGFYGPAAGQMARQLNLGSGNLLLSWRPLDSLETHLGGGVVSRAPSASERYYNLAPAPGGFQMGNPGLDPELRSEIELGVGWQSDHLDASLQAYHRWIEDYILLTLIAVDPTLGQIRGYRNVQARMYGLEASVTARFLRYMSLPLTLAYVRGQNETNSRPLPEIPPLELRMALRLDAGERFPWWAQFGTRFAARQTRIDTVFPENESPAFWVVHLRGGVEVVSGLHLEVGIENLLDEDYYEHLTREAPAAVGGLQAGDEVPEPGRSVYASVRWEF